MRLLVIFTGVLFVAVTLGTLTTWLITYVASRHVVDSMADSSGELVQRMADSFLHVLAKLLQRASAVALGMVTKFVAEANDVVDVFQSSVATAAVETNDLVHRTRDLHAAETTLLVSVLADCLHINVKEAAAVAGAFGSALILQIAANVAAKFRGLMALPSDANRWAAVWYETGVIGADWTGPVAVYPESNVTAEQRTTLAMLCSLVERMPMNSARLHIGTASGTFLNCASYSASVNAYVTYTNGSGVVKRKLMKYGFEWPGYEDHVPPAARGPWRERLLRDAAVVETDPSVLEAVRVCPYPGHCDPGCPYDPRCRPWYQSQALETGPPAQKVSIFLDSLGTMVATPTLPIYRTQADGTRVLVAVAAVEYFLDAVDEYLRHELDGPNTTHVVVVQNDAQLRMVGNRLGPSTIWRTSPTGRRYHDVRALSEAEEPPVAALNEWLLPRRLSISSPVSVDLDDMLWTVLPGDLDGGGLQYFVAVAMDREEVLGALDRMEFEALLKLNKTLERGRDRMAQTAAAAKAEIDAAKEQSLARLNATRAQLLAVASHLQANATTTIRTAEASSTQDLERSKRQVARGIDALRGANMAHLRGSSFMTLGFVFGILLVLLVVCAAGTYLLTASLSEIINVMERVVAMQVLCCVVLCCVVLCCVVLCCVVLCCLVLCCVVLCCVVLCCVVLCCVVLCCVVLCRVVSCYVVWSCVVLCCVVLCCVVVCCVVLCCVVLCCVVLCCVVLCRVVLCRVVSCRVVSCRVVSCLVVLCCVVLCCIVSCRVVLCCVVLCCVVLCCVVLCCVVLCCVVLHCVVLCCVALCCVVL